MSSVSLNFHHISVDCPEFWVFIDAPQLELGKKSSCSCKKTIERGFGNKNPYILHYPDKYAVAHSDITLSTFIFQ